MELTKDLRRILDIGIALTNEKDYNLLLEKILMESMKITNSDAGTLYVNEPDGLKFMLMRNSTLGVYKGGDGEDIEMPKVAFAEGNVCAYSAIHRKIINIPDVYTSEEFNFTGPKKYDAITGYRTKSMLVVPLQDHENEIIGVIQLMNAMDSEQNVTTYRKEDEYIINSIASQAAVTLANMNHIKEIKDMLYSMVSTLTTAIDERSPFNANHSKNVAKYAGELIDYINSQYEMGKTTLHFSEERREQIVMAAMLHDIGKLVTPLEIMNKPTRLGDGLSAVLDRFDLFLAWLKIDYYEKRVTKEYCDERTAYLKEVIDTIVKINSASYVDDQLLDWIEKISKEEYTDQTGRVFPFITYDEKENLSIRKGTLTAQERQVMEQHVVITSKLLAQIHFGEHFSDVPLLAGAHHEFLDGTGYPNKLNSETMPYDARILVILDIFDSLISDRPYKKSMPVASAMMILKDMAAEGKIDQELVINLDEYTKSIKLQD